MMTIIEQDQEKRIQNFTDLLKLAIDNPKKRQQAAMAFSLLLKSNFTKNLETQIVNANIMEIPPSAFKLALSFIYAMQLTGIETLCEYKV